MYLRRKDTRSDSEKLRDSVEGGVAVQWMGGLSRSQASFAPQDVTLPKRAFISSAATMGRDWGSSQ